jgi:hypothetical protein
MTRRLTVLVLFVTLLPATAFGQSLRTAADREGRRLAESQLSPQANPYKVPSIALIGGGAALLVIGLTQDRGAEVGIGGDGTSVSVTEKGGSKTALTVLGASAIGGGTLLWFLGESRKAAPKVSVTPGGIRIEKRFTF